MKKAKSIIKKAANLDLAAFKQGKKNYENGLLQELASERAKICAACDQCEDEPIDDLRVSDTIKEIDGKMCGACGCSLPYLLRQETKSCKLNKW